MSLLRPLCLPLAFDFLSDARTRAHLLAPLFWRVPRNLRSGVLEGQSPQNLVEDLSVTDLAVWKSEDLRGELRGCSERFPIISYRDAKKIFLSGGKSNGVPRNDAATESSLTPAVSQRERELVNSARSASAKWLC